MSIDLERETLVIRLFSKRYANMIITIDRKYRMKKAHNRMWTAGLNRIDALRMSTRAIFLDEPCLGWAFARLFCCFPDIDGKDYYNTHGYYKKHYHPDVMYDIYGAFLRFSKVYCDNKLSFV